MSVVEEGSLQGGKYPHAPSVVARRNQAHPTPPLVYPPTPSSLLPSLRSIPLNLLPTLQKAFLAWPGICQFSRLKLHPNLRPVHTHQLSKQHFTPPRFPNQPTHVSSLLLIPMTVPLFQPTVMRETLHSSELSIMDYCT